MPAEALVPASAAWSTGSLMLAQLSLVLASLIREGWGGARGVARGGGRPVGRPPAVAVSPDGFADELRGGPPGTPALGVVGASGLEDALSAWEGEGGSVRAPAPEPAEPEGGALAPSLPAGYTARLAWGFADQAGRFAYGFFRVYGPDRRLDPNLSYWAMRTRARPDDADEPWSGWWMDYAQARALAGPGLTFARFASPAGMPDGPPANLRARGPFVHR
ncbi:MAG TPA: hypothetical protein VFS43_10505 [Polyangiaceae bacterium]|nr:hypothetical protein [Polyangiaceae bacterium]